MLTNYDLTAWVEQNRGKIEALRMEALHRTNKHDSETLSAKADAMEEFTNWLADLLMPLAPFQTDEARHARRSSPKDLED